MAVTQIAMGGVSLGGIVWPVKTQYLSLTEARSPFGSANCLGASKIACAIPRAAD